MKLERFFLIALAPVLLRLSSNEKDGEEREKIEEKEMKERTGTKDFLNVFDHWKKKARKMNFNRTDFHSRLLLLFLPLFFQRRETNSETKLEDHLCRRQSYKRNLVF